MGLIPHNSTGSADGDVFDRYVSSLLPLAFLAPDNPAARLSGAADCRGDRGGTPASGADRASADPDLGPAGRLGGAEAAARHRLSQANPRNPNRKSRQ